MSGRRLGLEVRGAAEIGAPLVGTAEAWAGGRWGCLGGGLPPESGPSVRAPQRPRQAGASGGGMEASRPGGGLGGVEASRCQEHGEAPCTGNQLLWLG
jgi:hypothetical protein